MTLGTTEHRKLGPSSRIMAGGGESSAGVERDEVGMACRVQEGLGQEGSLLVQALSRENLAAAWKRVKANGGSAGVDGLTVTETQEYLKTHWPCLKAEILDGTYQPQAVRRVEIPKPTGGKRELGIPTVTDRLIQQALLQVMQPLIDPTFSDSSHGFRPGRSAHDAVRKARDYVQQGYRVVVDVDLEKFFDRVNHDILMHRLSKHISDKSVLRLVRRFLQVGVAVDGVVLERTEGTPQGGPLSPILANVLLDEVDKELEKRGHRFVRYADDCNIYVRSQKAGERVLRGLRRIYARLRLRVNEAKTAVSTAYHRKFLGYCLRPWSGKVKIAVHPKSLDTFRLRIRDITGRSKGNSMEQVAQKLRNYMPGWKNYFQLAETPSTFGKLDSWVRHRLRALQLAHWKRGPTIYSRLRALGASHELAVMGAGAKQRWWRRSGTRAVHAVLSIAHFDKMGFPRLT